MAYFDGLYTRFQTLVGGLFHAVSGFGTGGAYPSPMCKVQGGNYAENSPLNMDGNGNLMTRGPVMTDEESFIDDFTGSALVTSLTGTLTFTAGSNAVTGSGTVFLAELESHQGNFYIKLNSAAESTWAKIAVVNSDTDLALADNWSGSTGSGASSKTQWATLTGSGGSIAVSNSECLVTSGTTSGSRTFVFRDVDYCPLTARFQGMLSQRAVNQEHWMGFFNDPTNPTIYAVAVFDGTDATKVKFRTASAAGAANLEDKTYNLPGGVTSASTWEFEISIDQGKAILACSGNEIAEHILHVPGLYEEMYAGFGTINTSTASSTVLHVNQGFFANTNRLEIKDGMRGDALPVRIQGDVHNLIGTLPTNSKTADQIICQYTIPAGKYLYALGYSVCSADNTVRGSPVKIGKNTMTVVTNTVDGEVIRVFFLANRDTAAETFANPLYMGAGGDIVKITVTPDATTATTWYASLDYELRS